MKKWIKALSILLAAAIIVPCLCLPALAEEEAPAVLKVAFPEAAGINEVYEDGTYGGCVYVKLEKEPFDVGEMFSQLESMFAVQAKNQGLRLEVVCSVRQPFFEGDKMRLQQVLANLLSNSCKFTDKGGIIRLSVVEQGTMAGAAALRFSVKDSGIGIRQEDLQQIFRAFEQAAQSNQRFPGTGLGLAISSSLVELMGGELKVESKPGFGSEFYFTVAFPICEEAPKKNAAWEKQAEAQMEGLRILLAEDNDINAEIAMELLKSQKIVVDWAVDGRQAVELFAKSAVGAYKAILMDINMPVMDGMEATRQIRAMNRPDAGTVPILAMTANTFQEDRENAARAGMTGFLPKPFDVGQLFGILWEALGEINSESEVNGEAT